MNVYVLANKRLEITFVDWNVSEGRINVEASYEYIAVIDCLVIESKFAQHLRNLPHATQNSKKTAPLK